MGDTPEVLGVLVAEAIGVDGVDDDQVEPASDRVRESLLESSTSSTGISSGSETPT